MRVNDGRVGRRGQTHAVVGLVIGAMALAISGPAWAIDVKLSPEDAKKALEAGRAPMEKAASPEDVKKILQQASLARDRAPGWAAQAEAHRRPWPPETEA